MFRAAELHHGRFAQSRVPGPQGGDLHRDPNSTCARKEASQLLHASLFVRDEHCFAGSCHVASRLAAVPSFTKASSRAAQLVHAISAVGHNVPAIEMHAARQRIGNLGRPDIEERERLKIFPLVLCGSRVSR